MYDHRYSNNYCRPQLANAEQRHTSEPEHRKFEPESHYAPPATTLASPTCCGG